MKRIKAQSPDAHLAYSLVTDLQSYFVKALDALSCEIGSSKNYEAVEWFRDEGKYGGGVRYVSTDDVLFNRASVNISQVQYDADDTKALASATALSTIIHPNNPHAPSIHMHVSWTEMKDGKGYWRMMADLNPSILNEDDKIKFQESLEKSSGKYYVEASEQGDKYFFIPALKRHRGVSHFYLENFQTQTKENDLKMAKTLVENTIDTYIEIIKNNILNHKVTSAEDKQKQLDYHTLYLFQVLTLDRGTTSGLLVHAQNDVGILGSIPSHVNKELLLSWKSVMPKGQEALLQVIVDCIDEDGKIEESQKVKLAQAVRKFYQDNPDALKMQASGNVSVPTVQNHK